MWRLVVGILILCCGCSTRPVVDALDFVLPARMPNPNGQFYGGVGPPQPGLPAGTQPSPFPEPRAPLFPGGQPPVTGDPPPLPPPAPGGPFDPRFP